ncbi:glycosyltransferase family 4 protein [Leisingera aquaemixtae]|uniref:N, N'-diacetylbacillosaminyl-diphospho-undecaprenol alpha-1,3-N-acetylgalactosaminyltransferase n=1 Tax=Leisingera aquaemixtae TaxID=1396826 RepID=A0A0P1HKL8_9RHOB|nr:glycosyltransferase family 4 protein [Leisingera aquaemixtae]CUH97899.1 N, N'-diacetylbacillosaminyl-diphospho-undecaprenol alpha-1,3-N-acetylgalactosaminyltransferase [Leisingera aquaemixtae]
MKLVVTVNSSFNVVNFRSGLLRALMAAGHEITVLAPRDDYTEAILSEIGCRYVELKMDRRGTSPVREAGCLRAMIGHIRALRPDAILSYTIKNNLYAGLAARLTGTPIIPNVTGLGSVFSGKGPLAAFAARVYRHAFRAAPIVFFQNLEDQEQFLQAGLVASGTARILPGSGVDLARFTASPVPRRPQAPVFLLVARLLWEKGIGEYAEAARQVRKVFPEAVFRLAGGLETPGPAAVPEAVLSQWEEEGIIEYLGRQRDIRPVLAQATCVVMPSYYREGTPRALLEAGACGRPVITTDTAGCRTVVIDGESGFLVAPRDSSDLERAMLRIAGAPQDILQKMGSAGRALVERQFDEKIVIRAYAEALSEIAGKRPPPGPL